MTKAQDVSDDEWKVTDDDYKLIQKKIRQSHGCNKTHVGIPFEWLREEAGERLNAIEYTMVNHKVCKKGVKAMME